VENTSVFAPEAKRSVRCRTDAAFATRAFSAATIAEEPPMYMNTTRGTAAPSFPRIGSQAPGRQAAAPRAGLAPQASQFLALRAAYRAHGGLARGDDLARLLEDKQRGDFVALARLIVARQVFGFEWHGCLWMPLFQFELHDLSVREAPRQVLAELGAVFDSWSLATWFTQPNVWLCEQRPIDTLGKNLPAVLDAARADRFIANG
jgi:hypothetical protein